MINSKHANGKRLSLAPRVREIESSKPRPTKYYPSLGTHLFVKVPRPGDSEVTFSVFESSRHHLLPCLTTQR